MPTFVSILVLAIIVVVVSHPIQRRQSSAAESCRQTVTSVCRILWHIEDTIKHCPARSVCNSTALRSILAAIKADFTAWIHTPDVCQQYVSFDMPSNYTVTLEQICNTTHSQLPRKMLLNV
eukprot:Em0002g469a